MEQALGPQYVQSYASDQVLSQLGGRTVREALSAGEEPKQVWRAVCEARALPSAER